MLNNYKLSVKTAKKIKLLVHFGVICWLGWFIYLIFSEKFGADPVKDIVHYLGNGAMKLLLLSLAITPLAKILHQGQLMRLRRPLGLWCLFWASMHIIAWLSLDIQFDWMLFIGELFKRYYIVLGFIAWMLLFILGVTSIPALQRKLKSTWLTIHRSVYLVILLVCVHYWWSVKSGWIAPAGYLTVAVILLALRYKKKT